MTIDCDSALDAQALAPPIDREQRKTGRLARTARSPGRNDDPISDMAVHYATLAPAQGEDAAGASSAKSDPRRTVLWRLVDCQRRDQLGRCDLGQIAILLCVAPSMCDNSRSHYGSREEGRR